MQGMVTEVELSTKLERVRKLFSDPTLTRSNLVGEQKDEALI